VPSFCFAWGGEGHQLVALIAEDRLTPEAQAAVKDLLSSANISDAEVASWADEVKRERRETADWHYVNIPAEVLTYDAKRDGRSGDNVIDKLSEQAKVLADRSAPREKRVEALKWVVHLAGDLHQPLHVTERGKDRGGNTRLVFYPGRREAVSLHYVWDTLVVRDMIGKRKIADVAAALLKQNFPNEQEWSKGTPLAWANEAHVVARGSCYRLVPAEGLPPKLTSVYVTDARADIEVQVKRAGIRLVMLLNVELK
jgi:hypothetical protein